MPIFKAPNNDTFRRDREDQTDGLPEGCVIITEQELADILATRVVQITPDPKAIAQAEIDRLEAEQIKRSARMVREERLEQAEAYALANLGLTPEQLYAAASAPGAPPAFLTYKAMKDIDNAIKAQRALLA